MDVSEFVKSLTPEQREKAKKCTNAKEILAFAKEEKVALPDDVLAAVAGGAGQQSNGCGSNGNSCPWCGSELKTTTGGGITRVECTNSDCRYYLDTYTG